jgi:hypothetical protein
VITLDEQAAPFYRLQDSGNLPEAVTPRMLPGYNTVPDIALNCVFHSFSHLVRKNDKIIPVIFPQPFNLQFMFL